MSRLRSRMLMMEPRATGISEVQRIYLTSEPTSGNLVVAQVGNEGETVSVGFADLANATAATAATALQTALEDLSGILAGNVVVDVVSVGGYWRVFELTYQGTLANTAMPALTLAGTSLAPGSIWSVVWNYEPEATDSLTIDSALGNLYTGTRGENYGGITGAINTVLGGAGNATSGIDGEQTIEVYDPQFEPITASGDPATNATASQATTGTQFATITEGHA